MLMTWQNPKTKITLGHLIPSKKETYTHFYESRAEFPIVIGHVSERSIGYGLHLLSGG